jgi:hypothetical protein
LDRPSSLAGSQDPFQTTMYYLTSGLSGFLVR